MTQDEKALKVAEPSDFPESFAESWNRKDANELASLFKDDADFVNVTGIWWRTKGEIYKAHEYGLRVIFPDSELKITKAVVRKLSDSFAVVHARMRLKGQSTHRGEEAGMRYTLFSFVLEKVDDTWMCCSAQNTDIQPGKETHINASGESLKAVDYRT